MPNIVRTVGSEDAAHTNTTPNSEPKWTAAKGRNENDRDVPCRRAVKLDKCKSWKTLRWSPLEPSHKETDRLGDRCHKTSGHWTEPEGEVSHAPDSAVVEAPNECKKKLVDY